LLVPWSRSARSFLPIKSVLPWRCRIPLRSISGPKQRQLHGRIRPHAFSSADLAAMIGLKAEKAPWLEDLEHELLAFPGRHDDQIDALIQGLAYKREEFGFQQSGRHFGLI
jgi:hypothetical protein